MGRHLLLEFFELVILLLSVVFYLFLCFVPCVFDPLRPVWSGRSDGLRLTDGGEIGSLHSLAVNRQ